MATSPYHIKIAPMAKRQMQALTIKHQKMVLKLLEALSMNPRPLGVKKIPGMTGLYCESLAPFRLIYKVDEQELLLLLVK